MENVDITQIIEVIITLIGVVITSFLVPYIKTKMTANQFSYLGGIVKTAVYAAEVLFDGDGRGAEKRAYVEKYVEKICEQHKIIFDANAVRQMIEKSWLELTQEVLKNEEDKDGIQ